MAKKRLTVTIEPERGTLEKINKITNDMKKNLSSGFGEELSKNFAEIEKRVGNLMSQMDSIKGDKVAPKLFERINKESAEVSEALRDILKTYLELGSQELKSSSFSDLNKQIEESEKKIANLQKKLQNVGGLTSENAKTNRKKEVFHGVMGKEFESFEGTPASIGVSSIRSNITHLEAYITALEKVRTVEAELTAKQKKGEKLTPQEKKKLETIKLEDEKLKKIEELAKASKKQVDAEISSIDQINKGLQEETEKREYLLRLRDEETSKIIGDDSSLQKASELRKEVEGVSDQTKQNKTQAAIEIDNQRSEGAKDNEEIEQGLVRQNDLVNELLGKYFSINTAIKIAQKTFQKILTAVSDLDKAFVDIAVVTQYTNKEVWGMYDAFSRIAKDSGFSVAEIAKVAGEYFRQGESYSNVIKLTEAAAKAAKVAGIEAGESVRYLTAAVRGYNLAAEDAMTVSDKFAATAASSATDYEGLATAMSKVAAQAYSSGVEMDNLMGMIATAMEITQEAPENIGTAFKTIFARMAEIRDYGKVLEDGVDANRIEKALKTVNVALFDQNKNMRNLDDVLLEVGSNWHTLNQSQKAYLATSLAGTRQQTRLLAVLENYDRTLENIQTSRESEGATEAQQLKNLDSIAHNINRINVAIENMTTAWVNNQVVVGAVKRLASFLEGVSSLMDTLPGKIMGATAAVMAFAKAGKIIAGQKWAQDIGAGLTLIFSKNSEGNLTPLKNMKTLLTKMPEDIGVVTKALGGLQAAMGIASAVMFAAALVKIAYDFFSVEKAAERSREKIKKFSGELYNLNKSVSDIRKLTKEYEELSKKIIKSTDDLKRMNEVAQLIADADTSNISDSLINEDGTLNESEVKRVLDQLDKERKDTFNKQLSEREALLRKYKKLTDEESKNESAIAKAVRDVADSQFEVWDELDSKSQLAAKNWARTILDTGRYIDYNGNITSKESTRGIANEERTFSIKDVEKVMEFTENVNEANTTVGTYLGTLESIAGVNYDVALANDAMGESLIRFSEYTNLTIADLRSLEKILLTVKDYGIDFGEEVQDELAKALSTGSSENFSKVFVQNMLKAEASLGDVANMSLALVDAFDELSEDGLMDLMTSFDSIEKRIGDMGKSLENINTESIKELLHMVREYPDLADEMMNSIEKTGNITEEIAMKMVAADREKTKEMIQNEITQNEARIEILKGQMKIAETLLKDEAELDRMASDASIDLNNIETEAILGNIDTTAGAYKAMFEDIIYMAKQAGQKIPEALEGKDVDAGVLSGTSGTIQGRYRKGTNEHKMRVQAIVDSLNSGIDGYKKGIKEYENVNRVLQLSLEKVGTEAWNASDRFKDSGDAAKDAAGNIEIYTGQLHKLYVAQKKLELVKWGVDLIKAKQAYADAADAVKGLEGAQRNLYDMNSAQAVEDTYLSYELQKDQIKELMSVTEEYIAHHQGKLNPALKDTYKIINGQVYPVSAKYKNLTGEQMKELDEFAKTVNELGSQMQNYRVELLATEQAQNELIASMRDTIIDFQNSMIDIIKNQEKKQIDSFKVIIEANKKYLEERKKLYEKAFSDEDSDNEAEEIEKKRLDTIEKLANLEAAHDLTSIQKREAYLKELNDLNSEYNRLLLERNREAYLTSIDDQIEFQDETYQLEEELHNKRIESGEWLEARLKDIQDQARLEALWDHDLHNKTIQNMLDKNYITQEQITEMGLENLKTKLDDLSPEQTAVLEKHWLNNRDIIDDMWNNSEAGTVVLTETAMKKLLQYMESHSKDMEGKTTMMKEKILSEWKTMLNKVAEYTNAFNAIKLKGPDFSAVTSANSKLLSNIKSFTNSAVAEYQKLINKANETVKANNAANRINNAESGYGGKVTYSMGGVASKSTMHQSNHVVGTDGSRHTVGKDIGGYTIDGNRVSESEIMRRFGIKMPYKTGGTTEKTGLHWLDGKPGAPERVLSPGANQRFEALLTNLSAESENRKSDEVVAQLLGEIINAIYDSGEENADKIASALSDRQQTLSISGLARSAGISTNRRSDK